MNHHHLFRSNISFVEILSSSCWSDGAHYVLDGFSSNLLLSGVIGK
jgi:hypothetical protein